jgi:hypothetical protein
MQTQWKSQIQPALNNPLNNGVVLTNITLAIGDNVINHKLQRMQQGWIITDITGAATIYRDAPFNTLTLTLNSSAIVTINLLVF